jgi:hypothetical protein
MGAVEDLAVAELAKLNREEAEAASTEAVAERAAKREQARAEAVLARQVAEESASERGRQQRDAAAKQAIAEAEQKVRDAAVAIDPALARKQKEAEATQAIAEADKATATAEQSRFTALVPDFSKVTVPATSFAGDQTLTSAVLAHAALGEAASVLVKALVPRLAGKPDDVVLITTDEDLASADAAYVEVTTGLQQLVDSSEQLLPKPKPGIAAAPVLAAAAGAIPGLVSLLAPRTTVTSRALTPDTTGAVASVAQALLKSADPPAARKVRIDDFRLVPHGEVAAEETELRARRDKLADYKRTLSEGMAGLEAERDRCEKALEIAQKGAEAVPPTATSEQVAIAKTAFDTAKGKAADAGVKAGLVGDLIAVIDNFLVAIHNIPTGAKRSAFSSAALHEELRHPKGAPAISTVLYVIAAATATTEIYTDRTFSKDKYQSIASVSISYWAIDPTTSDIIDAGVAVGSVELRGKVGETPSIRPVPII